MKILVTGNAGFIGFHVAKKLLERGDDVVGFDSVNSYYDVSLKEARLKQLKLTAESSKQFHDNKYEFIKGNLEDLESINKCFESNQIDYVINLAAQAGVRYSLENPHAYIQSNVVGFTNILEACRHNDVKHLTYASTSSVYGANTDLPFSEHKGVDHPLQMYAATKRANELLAHSYSNLFNLPSSGLRFFTVYGPWGRPDMALFLFTKSILKGEPIKVFNHGNHTRDFTYIDDIVKGVIAVSDLPASSNMDWNSDYPDPASSNSPFRILNIGNNNPVKLSEYISAIELELGIEAKRELMPIQPGDVPDTFADVSELEKAVGYKPKTSVNEGVRNFVAWYRKFYNT
ncbi:MAG: NAD-dependent epimerase [SAR86 cluster bacterium]|nr:NAD-dependent epimerase [SAR86 cluster bacterium]